jgi:hypothetical protein
MERVNGSGGERLATVAAVGAAVAQGAEQSEDMVIRGVFSVECVGPREECREEYRELRDDVFALEAMLVEGLADEADRAEIERIIANSRDKMASMLEQKWTDTFRNTVMTAGKNFLLDNALAGSSYTATMYHGLVDGGSSPTYNAADTAASHSGWTESTAYSNSTRVAASWSSASSGSKALSSASAFSINGTATIAGCAMWTNSTKGGTSGTLISAGNFTGGNKSVANLDTLNVSYSLSI